MKTKVKICGLSRPEDILYVNAAKPDFAGFIVNYPKSRRNVLPEQVRTLAAGLAPEICPVGVFVDQPASVMEKMVEEGSIRAIQLHGSEPDSLIRRLQDSCRVPVIRAFQVKSREDVLRAKQSPADYILLDAGAGGGTTFNWDVIGNLERPYFLAGGLGPENVREAIRRLRPFAVDLSSKVETDGVKDEGKILRVMEEAACAQVNNE